MLSSLLLIDTSAHQNNLILLLHTGTQNTEQALCIKLFVTKPKYNPGLEFLCLFTQFSGWSHMQPSEAFYCHLSLYQAIFPPLCYWCRLAARLQLLPASHQKPAHSLPAIRSPPESHTYLELNRLPNQFLL